MRTAPEPRLILAAAALLFAFAAAYGPALTGPFQFDDYNVIADNPAVHSLAAWLDSMPGIRPLLKLSYALNWQASPAPFGFHLFNLVCHALNTALVAALLLLALNADQPRRRAIALLGAAIFALHPAQTEAVTYICGRSVGLMGLFYLGAIGSWLRGQRAVSLALLPAALLVKETAWTLPFALLLIEVARGTAPRAAIRALRWHWVALGFGAALLLAIGDYRRLLAHSLSIRALDENLLAQIAGQFYLLTQPLLSLRINIDPDIAVDPARLPAQAAVLLALIALGFALLRLPRWRWCGAGLLWFFLHLLPTNSLLPRNDLANDRQLYLALIGPALLVARAVVTMLPTKLGATAGAALALLLAISTGQRNLDYRSEVALWQATAQASPQKARVWNNLGYAQQQRGDLDAARTAYRRALQLDPDAVRARINLALLDDAARDGTANGK